MVEQETKYVEPVIEVSGPDPLATTEQQSSTTYCGCCFC
jgi:hypothetical protein